MRRTTFWLCLAAALPSCAEPVPQPRPDTVAAALSPVPQARPERTAVTLCGDPRLEGRAIAPIRGPGRCGIAAPVRLHRVAGVTLEPQADLGCEAATALADWIEGHLQPIATRHAGSGVSDLHVASSYTCRRINGRPSGRLSQHALGRAVDIAAFTMNDGRRITVSDGWHGDDRAFTRAAWRGACGPFGTVLGPAADRHHQHHFHLDVAQYSGGPYCREHGVALGGSPAASRPELLPGRLALHF